jgi:hypothetical protein
MGSDNVDHRRDDPEHRLMGDFSADWLRLREPADHRSRNSELARALAQTLRNKKSVCISDLGSGLGSNLRALAPHLPFGQHWTLLDRDSALLETAQDEIHRWQATQPGNAKHIGFSIRIVDIAHDIESIFDDTPDLITAAALFDLVSPSWIERLAEAITRRKIPFYATLTYDGSDAGTPAHALDAVIIAALHTHQHHDKGFGPAAGPEAISVLQKAFATRGYDVRVAPSPWHLDRSDAEMLTILGDGVAIAVAETGLVAPSDIAVWKEFHMPGGKWRDVRWSVGHSDILAVPKSSP